jgi:hypothetical protein
MIRAALRLPLLRHSNSQAPITPANSATSAPAGTHIAASRSDERCDGVSSSDLSCADVAASERNRCPLTELDNRLATTPRLASSATARCNADADVATLSREVGRADVARRSPATVPPLLSGVPARESPYSNESVRTSSTFAALGTAGSAFEATAPALSFAAVSCVPSALASPEPVSPALAEGSCADGAGGSAAFGTAGTAGAADTAGDAGADAAATEASGRAAGGVRDGSRGRGST